MASVKNLPAYLKWREGRPRWEPGPGLRKAGWKGRDLREEGGGWLSLEGAIAAAADLNRQVAAGAGRRPVQALPKVKTMRDLHAAWVASPKFLAKRPATRRDYALKSRPILDRFGDIAVRAIQHAHLYAWWQQLHGQRGHAMANGVLAVLRIMMSHAVKIGWRQDNPALKLDLETVPPRVVVWMPDEVASAVRTADAMGLTGLADLIVIALHTGQRQGDVLALTSVEIAGGKVRLKQSKRGARVAIPLSKPLVDRLEVIRQRRASAQVVTLSACRHLVQHDGKPYDCERVRKDFQRVRARVAETHADFAGKQLRDLRDTAVTRLAEAGCTVQEIHSITGHELETIHQVLKHYLAASETMAVSAVDKMSAYLEREGIAL